MSRHIVRGLLALAILAALAAGVGWLYRAARHVPGFYAEALRIEENNSAPVSRHGQQPVAIFSSAGADAKSWKGSFSDVQINKFLAIDLPKKYPDVLPPGIFDPRVSLGPDEARIGWRAERGWSAIYSLVIVPYVPRPNVLAIRIKRIRAGSLPVPLGEVVDGVSQAARRAHLRLVWQQVGGDPVALVELPRQDDSRRTMVLDGVQLGEGKIIVSGHVEESSEESNNEHAETASPDALEVRAADQSGVNEIRQQ